MISPELIERLRILKADGIARNTPNVSDRTGAYLHDFIEGRGYRHILELGTANGYSTLYLIAAAEPRDGHVLTIETRRESYEEARVNLAPYRSFVTQIHADAKEYAKSLSREKFDFIFIDAEKKETAAFFQAVWPLVRADGAVIVDDVVKYRRKMEDFYVFLDRYGIKYDIVMTDPDDGIMVIEKAVER